MNSNISCSDLSSRNDFRSYIDLVRNATGGDFAQATACKAEICGALWGTGNPDISGIGMAVGYIFESALSFVFTAYFLVLTTFPRFDTHLARLLLANGARTFFDNALFFAFAIQVASIATLAQANFGISAEGMEATTMKMAWTISELTLLALVPLVLNPQIFDDATTSDIDIGESLVSGNTSISNSSSSSSCSGKNNTHPNSSNFARTPTPANNQQSERRIAEARQSQRLVLFVACWALSFYPFFSRMAATFGRSQIASDPAAPPPSSPNDPTVISLASWTHIQTICFAPTTPIAPTAETLMLGFGVTSWLFTTLVVVCKILGSAFGEGWCWMTRCSLRLHLDTASSPSPSSSSSSSSPLSSSSRWGMRIWTSNCVLVYTFSIVQFWTFFRLRRFQREMTVGVTGRRGKEEIADEQWSFGQIVAVVIFAPVVAEVVFLWKRRGLFIKSG